MEHQMYTLAIETGGTKLQMILGTPDGQIVFKHHQLVVPSDGHKGTLKAIENALPMLRETAAKLGGSIEKAALGFGGIVDNKRGVYIASEQISGWSQFPMRDFLREKVGVPAFVYNDTDSATWGEYILGAGKNSRVFMYTNIGSGIGGGLVFNDRLYTGQDLGAIEIGQTFIHNIDSTDSMDFIQLERLCSGWGMEARLMRLDIPEDSLLWHLCRYDKNAISCKMLVDAVIENDPFSTDFFDRTIRVYSTALANAISILAPDTIAIGGGVSLAGEPLFSRIDKYISAYVANNVRNRYNIVRCQLGEEVVPIGALLLSNC